MTHHNYFLRFVLLVLFVVLLVAPKAEAEDLEVGHIYRLGITMTGIKEMGVPTTDYTALKNSKFVVLGASGDGTKYLIQFTRIYTDESYSGAHWVTFDKVFEMPRKYGELNAVSITSESLTGLSSGPLVVPFKYRLDDKTITGDATIGLYAGITYEPFCAKTGWCFRITPLISAGLSQISVSNGTQTQSKSGLTIAAGFLITNWANLNIGLVYGQDRIGDSTWEHEGKGWLSFMIGWQL